jgi:hypothetical protein
MKVPLLEDTLFRPLLVQSRLRVDSSGLHGQATRTGTTPTLRSRLQHGLVFHTVAGAKDYKDAAEQHLIYS